MVIVELPNRLYCSIHKTYFSKDSFCSMCKKESTSVSSGAYGTHGTQSDKGEIQTNLTNNSLTNTNKSRRVYVTKNIVERFHAYRMKFEADVEWAMLFAYEELSLNNNVKFKRIDFPEAIVRVFKKSVLITLRSSKEIKGLNVKEAKIVSDGLIKSVLDKLPKAIKVKDKGFISSVHNAFINHPYAKRDIKVIDNNDEVRFISDNSHGNPEFEAINKVHAISDSEAIERDTLSLIDKGLSREFIAEAIMSLIKDREYYAENLKSHVEAIKTLSDSIQELKHVVKSERVKSVKNEWGW